MSSQFSFSFSGEDIDEEAGAKTSTTPNQAAAPASGSAFPVQGKPLLPPVHHDLSHMLSTLPSKVAYSLLAVDLDGRGTIEIPRRELWDVRVQVMAEEEVGQAGQDESGLGKHDVRTGIYEGGFKSWESSVDLVKVLAAENSPQILSRSPCRIVELGCGTALPSLALFQWASTERASGAEKLPMMLTLADYNPTVLYLVTLPNFLLAWALQQRDQSALLQEALASEGELAITPEIAEEFKTFLASQHMSLSFVSGGWSPELVELLYGPEISFPTQGELRTLVLGAETIYSPFALDSFTETLLSILRREHTDRPSGQAAAIIAAKRLYFGVGGSLDDFIHKVKELGVVVDTLREETEGVRRGVVRCALP